MKPLKIIEKNAAAIEAALLAVNGRAHDHAYTTFAEVAACAAAVELRLGILDLPVAMRAGARFTETSGASVPNAYKYPRTATSIRCERRTSGWYLVSASSVTIYQRGGGPAHLSITAAQAAEVARRHALQYTVIEVEEERAAQVQARIAAEEARYAARTAELDKANANHDD